VGTALARASFDLRAAEADPVGSVKTFLIDPQHPAFARDATWQDAFDDLRQRKRRRGERPYEWRRDAPLRRIAFEPPILPDERNADHVVQVHLEHRLVRRLLGRFLSQGFQSGLNRVTVITGPGAQPRIVLIGRIALYGPGAARLHEEILPVTAIWRESERGLKPLRPLGERGEETTMDQLEDALTRGQRPSTAVVERAISFVRQDVDDLLPTLQGRAEAAVAKAATMLADRGREEAKSLADLLTHQRQRIQQAEARYDDRQIEIDFEEELERRQRRADRKAWLERLDRIDRELETEPARVEEGYTIKARRLEPVGLVYLWPVTG
jgi:hypothetical protein